MSNGYNEQSQQDNIDTHIDDDSQKDPAFEAEAAAPNSSRRSPVNSPHRSGAGSPLPPASSSSPSPAPSGTPTSASPRYLSPTGNTKASAVERGKHRGRGDTVNYLRQSNSNAFDNSDSLLLIESRAPVSRVRSPLPMVDCNNPNNNTFYSNSSSGLQSGAASSRGVLTPPPHQSSASNTATVVSSANISNSHGQRSSVKSPSAKVAHSRNRNHTPLATGNDMRRASRHNSSSSSTAATVTTVYVGRPEPTPMYVALRPSSRYAYDAPQLISSPSKRVAAIRGKLGMQSQPQPQPRPQHNSDGGNSRAHGAGDGSVAVGHEREDDARGERNANATVAAEASRTLRPLALPALRSGHGGKQQTKQQLHESSANAGLASRDDNAGGEGISTPATVSSSGRLLPPLNNGNSNNSGGLSAQTATQTATAALRRAAADRERRLAQQRTHAGNSHQQHQQRQQLSLNEGGAADADGEDAKGYFQHNHFSSSPSHRSALSDGSGCQPTIGGTNRDTNATNNNSASVKGPHMVIERSSTVSRRAVETIAPPPLTLRTAVTTMTAHATNAHAHAADCGLPAASEDGVCEASSDAAARRGSIGGGRMIGNEKEGVVTTRVSTVERVVRKVTVERTTETVVPLVSPATPTPSSAPTTASLLGSARGVGDEATVEEEKEAPYAAPRSAKNNSKYGTDIPRPLSRRQRPSSLNDNSNSNSGGGADGAIAAFFTYSAFDVASDGDEGEDGERDDGKDKGASAEGHKKADNNTECTEGAPLAFAPTDITVHVRDVDDAAAIAALDTLLLQPLPFSSSSSSFGGGNGGVKSFRSIPVRVVGAYTLCEKTTHKSHDGNDEGAANESSFVARRGGGGIRIVSAAIAAPPRVTIDLSGNPLVTSATARHLLGLISKAEAAMGRSLRREAETDKAAADSSSEGFLEKALMLTAEPRGGPSGEERRVATACGSNEQQNGPQITSRHVETMAFVPLVSCLAGVRLGGTAVMDGHRTRLEGLFGANSDGTNQAASSTSATGTPLMVAAARFHEAAARHAVATAAAEQLSAASEAVTNGRVALANATARRSIGDAVGRRAAEAAAAAHNGAAASSTQREGDWATGASPLPSNSRRLTF